MEHLEKTFFELIARRESCRSYDNQRLVTKEQLVRCLEAAQLSPSACNSQPWGFVAVSRPELARQVAEATGQGFALNAPAFIVVTEEYAALLPRALERFERQHFAQIDVGIAVAHLCLAATAQGLSTCILGLFDEQKLGELLNLQPEKIRLVITVGYAATDKLREKRRKDLTETCSFIE